MPAPTDDEIRKMAQARVAFRFHALAYVLVNAMLVVIWAGTSQGGPTFDGRSGAYFWPVWPMLGWGIGLAMHGYGAYGGGQGAVAREEEKLRAKYGGR